MSFEYLQVPEVSDRVGRCSADPRDKPTRDPEAGTTKAGTTKGGATKGGAKAKGGAISAGAGAEAATTASGATGGDYTGDDGGGGDDDGGGGDGGGGGGMARVKRRRTYRGLMGCAFAWWRSFWASVVSVWDHCYNRCYTWALGSCQRLYVVRWFTFHIGLLRAEGRIGAFIVLDRVGWI